MKRMVSIIVSIMLLCFCVNSCGDPAITTGDNKINGEFTVEEKEFFDLNEEYRPSNSEMQQIKEDMTFVEIINKIGKPHGYGSGLMSFSWKTKEGKIFNISFLFNENYPQNTEIKLNDYYVYGIALSDPWM